MYFQTFETSDYNSKMWTFSFLETKTKIKEKQKKYE